MPSEEHFHEALPSDRLDQLAKHAKRERQGKHPEHDRQKSRLFYREERLSVCFDKSDVLMAYERDYLLYVMEDHRGDKVKAGIPQRAID